jgi:hypothetical protein
MENEMASEGFLIILYFIVCTQDTTLNVGPKGAWRLALGFESSLRDA